MKDRLYLLVRGSMQLFSHLSATLDRFQFFGQLVPYDGNEVSMFVVQSEDS